MDVPSLTSVDSLPLVVGGIGAALVSAGVVGLLVRWAPRLRLVDVPNERSSHAHPTPRGGGIGIVVPTLGVASVLAASSPEGAVATGIAWVCAMAVALVSLRDDFKPLPALARLAVHLLAAAALARVLAGPWAERMAAYGLPEGALGEWIVGAVIVLWVAGMTNVYNFLDGIDGIAGVQAVVAGVAMALALLQLGHDAGALLAATLAGGAAGFLVWNRPPARIFMGDVGSAFLGFLFGALPLLPAATAGANDVREVALPLVAAAALWPFLADGIFTFLARLARGENVLASHRGHLYQRLVIAGATHGSVTMLYGTYAFAGALSALWAWTNASSAAGLFAAAIPLVLGVRLYLRVRSLEAAARATAAS